MYRTINIEELVLGMYVNKVCAQTGNVSIKNKGVVRSFNVVKQLSEKGVLSVEIDVERSEVNDSKLQQSSNIAEQAEDDTNYPPVNFETCQRLYSDAFLLQKKLRQALINGHNGAIDETKKLSEHVCHSLTVNSDAMLALTLLKQKKDYLYEQSINNAILAIRFGLYLDLSNDEVVELGMAALLMDIGMTHIPDSILTESSQLNPEQYKMITEHVSMSLKLLENFEEGQYPSLASIIEQHHERKDGSGYPNQIRGDEISQGAQILGIIDSYNAMISERPYRTEITANAALSQLLSDNKKYSASLVQSFIRSVGIHPIGSLVKLKSGKLGIVIRQHKTQLVEPVVIVFYSVSAKHPIATQRIDLSLKTDAIEHSVHPNEHNFNIQQFLQEYLMPNIF